MLSVAATICKLMIPSPFIKFSLSSDDKPVDHDPAGIKKAKRLFAGHAKPVDRLSQ
jgi:hypothetical protein